MVRDTDVLFYRKVRILSPTQHAARITARQNTPRHTASRLAEEGATVIVHGRREAAVKEAVEYVKGKGNGQQRVEGVVADLSSLRGMNHLCDEVLARTDRLDCLLNNAGERRQGVQI